MSATRPRRPAPAVAISEAVRRLAAAASLLLALAPAWGDDRLACIDGADELAVPACQRALERTPGEFSLWVALGDALGRLKRHGEAAEAFARAAAIDPGNGKVAQKLRLARSNVSEAEFLRRRGDASAQIEGGHAAELDRIRCTRLAGDIALAACERALRTAPGNPELLAARARLGAAPAPPAARESAPSAVPRPGAPPPADDLAERLAALKRLRDAEIINAAEYESRRQLVLNAITGLAPPVAASPPSVRFADIDFGRYHALVVGMDRYRDLPALETATNDARAVAEVLERSYGFEVRLLTDATRSQIIEALDEYRARLGQRDNLLIYYAGHGWLDQEADQGFWLPVDARRDSRVNWISNDSIRDAARAMKAKHVLVVADSCFSGTLTRSVRIPDITPDYLRRMASKRARLALSSGGLEPVADATDDGRHSPFARSFIDALRANDGVLDGTQLFTRLRHPVMVNADQSPEYADIRRAGHDGGDFLFVRR